MKNALCEAGAAFARNPDAFDGGGWASMEIAPRDGTVIEIRNSYGVAPSYGLFQWTKDCFGFSWHKHDDERSGLMNDGEYAYVWRPFRGDTAAYVDPTRGHQDSREYWRGALASRQGLRPDAFEAIAARNAVRNLERD